MNEPGKKLTREDFKKAFNRPHPRDAFSLGERLQAFDELDLMHNLHQAIGNAHIIITADTAMGAGLSLTAAVLCDVAQQSGASVYSTVSSGITFGRRVGLEHLIGIPDDINRWSNSLVVIEGSDFLHWHDYHPDRMGDFLNSLQLWRKLGMQIVFVQKNAALSIPPGFRSKFSLQLEVVPQPREGSASYKFSPRHKFDPLDAEDGIGARDYPDWCYLHCYVLRRKGIVEPTELPAPGYRLMPSVLDELWTGISHTYIVHHFPMPPERILRSAKLLDSFGGFYPSFREEKQENV